MTLYEFNALDEAEQMEAIWYKSVELGKRKDETYEYTLYQIGSFYVEMQYHIEWKIIRDIKSFATTRLLEPYLGNIVIPKIS